MSTGYCCGTLTQKKKQVQNSTPRTLLRIYSNNPVHKFMFQMNTKTQDQSNSVQCGIPYRDQSFTVQIKWLVSIWNATLSWKQISASGALSSQLRQTPFQMTSLHWLATIYHIHLTSASKKNTRKKAAS